MNNWSNESDKKSEVSDPLTAQIIGCAIALHRVLGPGFLENIYHQGLAHEFNKAQIPYISEARMQVIYDQVVLGDYIADFLLDKRVVVELKAVETLTKAHEIQLVNYLTAIRFDVGLLINFGGSKVQVKRKVRELARLHLISPSSPVVPVSAV